MEGTHHEINGIAGRVGKVDEPHYPPGLRFGFGAATDGNTGIGQGLCGGIEFLEAADFKTERVVLRVTLEIADIVIAMIATQINRAVFAYDFFQPDGITCKRDGIFKIGCAKTAVSYANDFDHPGRPCSASQLASREPSSTALRSGLQPQAQNEASATGNCRARQLSSTMRTPQEYS